MPRPPIDAASACPLVGLDIERLRFTAEASRLMVIPYLGSRLTTEARR